MDAEIDGIGLERLCAPIAGDAPAGVDLRADFSPDSPYFRLRDARAEARAAERQADAAGIAEPAGLEQWRTVQQLAVAVLSERSKDLEIAAWCAEALLRRLGLDGLAAGATLMAGLIERFWDVLHPLPDEDEGIGRRLAPVAGLNGEGGEGTLIQPLRKLVLFVRPDGTALALWQYQQAVEVAGIGEESRRAQRLAAGVPAFETVENEARAAAGALAALHRSALAAAAAWEELGRVLDARAGADAPSLARVRDLLAEIAAICARYAPAGADLPAAAVDAPADAPRAGAAIGRRDEALRQLEQIASFFQQTEPHSPLAYTLREAVRRARLSWPELLEEVVPDYGGRAAILMSLGIRPPPPPE